MCAVWCGLLRASQSHRLRCARCAGVLWLVEYHFGTQPRCTGSRRWDSVEVLRELQRDEHASASARVSAARAMLESGLKLAELVALDERVTMIEARQEAMR